MLFIVKSGPYSGEMNRKSTFAYTAVSVKVFLIFMIQEILIFSSFELNAISLHVLNHYVLILDLIAKKE
jgi:hypothetical protein